MKIPQKNKVALLLLRDFDLSVQPQTIIPLSISAGRSFTLLITWV